MQEQHMEIFSRIRILIETTPSDLLPCHQHLLDNNFCNLCNAETIQQQIWIASMESTLNATFCATSGQIKPRSMSIFNSRHSSTNPQRSTNHHSQTMTRPCPDPPCRPCQQTLLVSFWVPPQVPPCLMSPPDSHSTDLTGTHYCLHWGEESRALFLIWVWSDLYASSHDKNDLSGHYIAPVQLLCLYGREERQKLVCPYTLYYKLEIRYIWVIL
jgi:hypothetical protein